MESTNKLPNHENLPAVPEIHETKQKLDAYADQLTAVITPHADVLVKTIYYLNELQMNYGFCRHASIVLCTKWLVYWQQRALAALSQKEVLTNEDLILLGEIKASISEISAFEIDAINDVDICMPDDLAGKNHAELIFFLEKFLTEIDGATLMTERIKSVFRPPTLRSAENGKSHYSSLFLTEVQMGTTTIEMFPTLYGLDHNGERVELFSVDHFSRDKLVQEFQRISKEDITRLIDQRAAADSPSTVYHRPIKQENDFFFRLQLPVSALSGNEDNMKTIKMYCLLGAGTQYSYQIMRDHTKPEDQKTIQKATTRMQLSRIVSRLLYKNLGVRDIIATVRKLESEIAATQT